MVLMQENYSSSLTAGIVKGTVRQMFGLLVAAAVFLKMTHNAKSTLAI